MSGMISTPTVEYFMILSYKELHTVQFPVFILPSSNWHTQDGLFFVDNKLVDDRNIDKPTLGQRRIVSPQGDFLPLGKALIDEVGVIKQSTKAFIDSKGQPFIYAKTKMANIEYYKIDDIQGLEHCSRIKVFGLRNNFLVPRPPEPGMTWAGIIHLHGYAWKIYEFSETYKPPTRRKI